MIVPALWPIAPSARSVTVWPGAAIEPPSAMSLAPASRPTGPWLSIVPAVVVMPCAVRVTAVLPAAPAFSVSRPPAVTASASVVATSAAPAVMAPVLLIVTLLPRTATRPSPGEACSVIVGTAAPSATAPVASALQRSTRLARLSWIAPALATVAP